MNILQWPVDTALTRETYADFAHGVADEQYHLRCQYCGISFIHCISNISINPFLFILFGDTATLT